MHKVIIIQKDKEIMKRRMKKSLKRIAVATLFLAPALIGIYGLSQHREPKVVAETPQVNSQQEFIQAIAPSAVEIANANDLYPSVMIAQAMHESNSGQSGLAARYGNLFGIKGAYNGNAVSLETWEDDGQGNAYKIMDNFRVYPSWAESLQDYARLLQWNRYAGVHRSNTSTYQDATAALTGTYATDTSYAQKLNYYIEAYGLTAYDNNDSQATQTGSGVWNSYRGRYTSQEILDEDLAWANRFNH